MTTKPVRMCSVFCVILYLAGYSGVAAAQRRVEAKGRWEEVFRIDDEHGRTFLKPELLAANGEVVNIFDYGDLTISSYTLAGKHLWTRGRKGSGPGEFTGGTDLVVDGRGTTNLLDPSSSRITVYSPTGQYQRSIALDQQLHRVVFHDDGSFIGSPLSDKFITSYDNAGRRIAETPLPAELGALSPLVRENRLLRASPSEVIVLHSWSTKILVIRTHDLGIARSSDLLNVQTFPELKAYKSGKYVVTRVNPAATRVVRAAATDRDSLYVVDGREPDNREYIDTYSVKSLLYVSSRAAPDHLRAFVVRGNLLIGLVDDPLPALVAWRWK